MYSTLTLRPIGAFVFPVIFTLSGCPRIHLVSESNIEPGKKPV